MATIQVSDDVYQKLTLQANMKRLTVEELVEPIISEFATATEQQINDQSTEQWQQWFQTWQDRAKTRSAQYPPGFRADVSRESIYEGR